VADDTAHTTDDPPVPEKSGWYAIFTFETVHQAVAAEDVLRRARVDLEEVPPPPEVDAACDLAVRIPLGELYEAIGMLATEDAGWEAVYELGERQEVVARLG
jgi:Putative Se/S carrier protein-like